ncbi:MAG: hypothetical protein R3B06_19560 [Kofleriaceae bacterium]
MSCGATCSASFGHGTSVTLTAGAAASSASPAGAAPALLHRHLHRQHDRRPGRHRHLRRQLLHLHRRQGRLRQRHRDLNPAGINCGATCAQSVTHGTSLTLSASPAVGSTFASWSGGGCSGTGTCTVTVTAATTVTATFPSTATRSASPPTAPAAPDASPAGINCGATCASAFNYGTTVTLTATPIAGHTFNGWSGAGCSGTGTCTVSMTTAQTVTATFTAAIYTLTVTKLGGGSSTSVSSFPAGVSCGATCTAQYPAGSVVELDAFASGLWIFSEWTGDCAGTDSFCTFTMDANKAVTAQFIRDFGTCDPNCP